MVTSVTSFGKNGLYDWVVQRSTAVILGVYFLCVVSFLITHDHLTYAEWKAYMTSTSMVVFTTLALVSVVLHAWIGLWTVSTDYLTSRQLGSNGTLLRLAFQAVYMLVNAIYLVWGLRIVWGA